MFGSVESGWLISVVWIMEQEKGRAVTVLKSKIVLLPAWFPTCRPRKSSWVNQQLTHLPDSIYSRPGSPNPKMAFPLLRWCILAREARLATRKGSWKSIVVYSVVQVCTASGFTPRLRGEIDTLNRDQPAKRSDFPPSAALRMEYDSWSFPSDISEK